MSVQRKTRYRADDLWNTPDDGKIYEVIEGVLCVVPPPRFSHQNAIMNLLGILYPHIRARGLGKIVPAPVAVVLDEENGVEPDIVFVSAERLHIISERGIEGPPDLVVEVLSPRTEARDRGVKMRRYVAADVPHYWMLAPRTRELEAYRLGPGGDERVGVYGPGSVFEPELFPGLAIPVEAT